jgi:hypothetical protein
MITIEQQFAEKLHSYTLYRPQINTRTKDLIDLLFLLDHKNRILDNFLHALQRVFRDGNTHPLPKILPQPTMSWQKPFDRMAAEWGISQSLKNGFIKISEFYNTMQKMS